MKALTCECILMVLFVLVLEKLSLARTLFIRGSPFSYQEKVINRTPEFVEFGQRNRNI